MQQGEGVHSYLIAGRWLEGYSYRIENSPLIYLCAAAILLLAAVASISWQAAKLMDTDPVDALKSE